MKLMITLLLMASATLAYGQNDRCGTMELLKEKMAQDPGLEQRLDSMEQATQAMISELGPVEEEGKFNPPLIPGYTPTGDRKTDVRNFCAAKQALYDRDPELYRQLTRNPTSANQKKSTK